jgi:hypothetical protein
MEHPLGLSAALLHAIRRMLAVVLQARLQTESRLRGALLGVARVHRVVHASAEKLLRPVLANFLARGLDAALVEQATG